jgi:hypothetical protein
MNMALPEAIQNQVAEAEALQQQVYGQASETGQTAEPVVEPVAPVVEPQVAETVTEVVKPEPAPVEDDRYKTLQSKYNAEVPRLHRELKERDQQMQALAARLEQLEKQPEPKKEESLLTDQDDEDFGADLVAMVRRATREEARRSEAAVLAEVNKLLAGFMNQLGAVQERVYLSEADKFWAKVEALVPDWKTLDVDPAWIEFLNTTPDFTTETYRDLAAKAIQAGDHNKVAKLVDIWRGPKQAEPVKQPVNPELQRQVVPSTVKASSSLPATGKIWSKEEYEAAYDVRNVTRYGQKKADEMSAEADRAVAEGRVRW